MKTLKAFSQECWIKIRELSGDDAYERYLQHYAEMHAAHAKASQPLTRKAYFKNSQEEKWKGIKRCC